MVVVGAITATVIATSGKAHVAMPASIAGQSQFHNSQTQVLVKGMQDTLKKQSGVDAVGGFYGTPTQPEFFVVAFDKGLPANSDLMSGAASGFGKSLIGSSGYIDQSSVTKHDVGSVHYECAPYSVQSTSGGSSLSADICMWNDGKTVGMVMLFDKSLDSLSTAESAHGATTG